MSLLAWAIYLKWAPLIELMAQKWPIRGDERATSAFYLHHCLHEAVLFRDFDQGYPKEDNISKQTDFRIYQLPFAAGVDHSATDYNGQRPVSIVLSGLDTRLYCIEQYACWLKPLSQGLQVNIDVYERIMAHVKTESDTRRSEMPNFPFTPDPSVYKG